VVALAPDTCWKPTITRLSIQDDLDKELVKRKRHAIAHLEERLMNEMVELVARGPNEGTAGRLVEMWLKLALESWLTRFLGRNKQHDESWLLFVWDLAGSALA
jgi:hypothetical protein